MTVLMKELVLAIETLQEGVNEIEPIEDVNSLLQSAEQPIEDIMDLVLDIPGFTEKYPDLKKGDDLDAVPDAPPEAPPEGEGDAPGGEGNEAGDRTGTEGDGTDSDGN